MNERLLIEIAQLRHLQDIGVSSVRITHCLEILRYIRNTELSINSEEGLNQENRWISLNGNDYHEQLKQRLNNLKL